MVNGVDPNMYVYTDGRLLGQSFIDYVNDYVKYVVGQGASIYFNFSPTNQLALKSSKSARQNFHIVQYRGLHNKRRVFLRY